MVDFLLKIFGKKKRKKKLNINKRNLSVKLLANSNAIRISK